MTRRTGTCLDCGLAFEHMASSGPVPKRCLVCREAVKSVYRKRSYVRHRERRQAEARSYHYAKTPRTKVFECARCHRSVAYLVRRGGNPKLCEECRASARLEAAAKFRAANRKELRAQGRAYARARRLHDADYARLQREAARRRRAEVPDEVRAARLRHYWSDPEKMRARRRASRVRNRLAVFDRYNGICHICGEQVSRDLFEIDHILPVSRGGTSDADNLGLAHFHCNRRKAARLLEELVL